MKINEYKNLCNDNNYYLNKITITIVHPKNKFHEKNAWNMIKILKYMEYNMKHNKT